MVHDEAARAWSTATGTACGNAGLFSTAADLARFAQLWLDEGSCNGRQILAPEDVRSTFNDVMQEGSHGRGWCWQIDAAFYMSHVAPRGSAGHTGFTGPTFFLNPTTRDVAIILENRVCPTRHGPNRMPYHQRIAQWLFHSL
jgi:CubicO group peptidase (beta-lactamase class C family)